MEMEWYNNAIDDKTTNNRSEITLNFILCWICMIHDKAFSLKIAHLNLDSLMRLCGYGWLSEWVYRLLRVIRDKHIFCMPIKVKNSCYIIYRFSVCCLHKVFFEIFINKMCFVKWNRYYGCCALFHLIRADLLCGI